MRSPALMMRSSGWCSRSHACAVAASVSTTKTAWLARTSGSGSPPKARARPSRTWPHSTTASAECSDTLLAPAGAGSRYTATPALSGPRSLIWPSIAPRCSPRRSSTPADLLNSPTIPHILWLSPCSRLADSPLPDGHGDLSIRGCDQGKTMARLHTSPFTRGPAPSHAGPRVHAEAALGGGDRPERLAQPGAPQRWQRLGVDAVVG